MKTLTINWISWIKVYFMAANTTTNSQQAIYHRTLNNKMELKKDDKKPVNKEKTKPSIGDLMRTAHRGNFSAGPTFLFHPGWFK